MAWIFCLKLLPTFYGKETLFSITSNFGKSIYLAMIMINKIRASYARVKIQVDLAATLPSQVEIKFVNSAANKTRVEIISI